MTDIKRPPGRPRRFQDEAVKAAFIEHYPYTSNADLAKMFGLPSTAAAGLWGQRFKLKKANGFLKPEELASFMADVASVGLRKAAVNAALSEPTAHRIMKAEQKKAENTSKKD